MRRPRRMLQTLGAAPLAGCGCGGACGCGPDCPCRRGLAGFDMPTFHRQLAHYERAAYQLGPDFGRTVTGILAARARRRGLGEWDEGGDAGNWSAADITPIDTSAFDLSTFMPADSSGGFDTSTFDAGTITVTAPSGGGGAIDVTPWFSDFTAIDPINVTPINLDAIAQDFANWSPAASGGCFSSPGAFAKCAVATAGNIAKGITGGAGGGGAPGGAASVAQKPAATPPKQASLLPFVLIGVAVFALADIFSD